MSWVRADPTIKKVGARVARLYCIGQRSRSHRRLALRDSCQQLLDKDATRRSGADSNRRHMACGA